MGLEMSYCPTPGVFLFTGALFTSKIILLLEYYDEKWCSIVWG
jgi:hypothetical protein